MFQIEKYCQMFELFCHLKTMLKTILRPGRVQTRSTTFTLFSIYIWTV